MGFRRRLPPTSSHHSFLQFSRKRDHHLHEHGQRNGDPWSMMMACYSSLKVFPLRDTRTREQVFLLFMSVSTAAFTCFTRQVPLASSTLLRFKYQYSKSFPLKLWKKRLWENEMRRRLNLADFSWSSLKEYKRRSLSRGTWASQVHDFGLMNLSLSFHLPLLTHPLILFPVDDRV